MKASWPQSIAYVLENEGAEINRSSSEPGGISKYGVSLETYRESCAASGLPRPSADTIAALTADQAAAFYRSYFADHILFDYLPAGVDYRLLDITVNLGRSGGPALLAGVVGLSGSMSELAAAAAGHDAAELIKALGAAWLAKKQAGGGWAKYGRGWTNRSVEAEGRALAMIAAAPPAAAAPSAPSIKPSQGPSPMNIVDRFVDLAGFKQHLDGLQFTGWRPGFVVVHNTSSPDLALYAQWRARGAAKWTPEQWGRNLASYYGGMGWRSGPHAFVCPDGVLLFSPFTAPGTHSPAWNARTWGIETVGEFEREPFAGSPSETNLVNVLAMLHARIGLDPADYKFGVRGLHFHKEDPVTTHKSCPGRNLAKPALVANVVRAIQNMHDGGHADVPAHVQAADTGALTAYELTSIAYVQDGLNKIIGAGLKVDNDLGGATKKAVGAYQQARGLTVDDIPGPLTRTAIKDDLAKLSGK